MVQPVDSLGTQNLAFSLTQIPPVHLALLFIILLFSILQKKRSFVI